MKSTTTSRFVCLGIPGLVLLYISLAGIVTLLDNAPRDSGWPSWIILPAGACGAVLLLIGVGKLKQWGYVIVFASIPFLLFLFLWLWKSLVLGALLTLVGAVAISVLVGRYYRRRMM